MNTKVILEMEEKKFAAIKDYNSIEDFVSAKNKDDLIKNAPYERKVGFIDSDNVWHRHQIDMIDEENVGKLVDFLNEDFTLKWSKEEANEVKSMLKDNEYREIFEEDKEYFKTKEMNKERVRFSIKFIDENSITKNENKARDNIKYIEKMNFAKEEIRKQKQYLEDAIKYIDILIEQKVYIDINHDTENIKRFVDTCRGVDKLTKRELAVEKMAEVLEME